MTVSTKRWHKTLRQRWEVWQDDVLRPLRILYGERPDFDEQVARCLKVVVNRWRKRSAELRASFLISSPRNFTN